MRFTGLDGRSYTVSVGNYKVVKDADGRGVRSSHHLRARQLLRDMFRSYTIMEEMKVQGAQLRNLYLDFYIPTLKIAVEVHGRQHYEYVPHFHKGRMGYINHLKRDRLKREWCELNELDLVVLKYSDDVEDWREQLESR